LEADVKEFSPGLLSMASVQKNKEEHRAPGGRLATDYWCKREHNSHNEVINFQTAYVNNS
jgi:hypothetical protein